MSQFFTQYAPPIMEAEMTGHEIREKFLQFFESKNHKVMPSASLNPATYGDYTTNLT